MKRRTAVVVILLALIGGGVWFFFFRADHAEITVINHFGEKVTGGKIQIAGQQIDVGPIEPGQSKVFRYPVRMEGTYAVTLETESGRQFKNDVGYVSKGMHARDQIELDAEGQIFILGED